ncbi:acetyltransferase [Candidatus Pelagibacter sp.]|nr:acetyltransferase [Candidatus Pelagibacter sp.]
MSKKIAIIGAGGHGKVVGEIALLSQYKKIDFFDDRINEIVKFPFTIINKVDFLKNFFKDYDDFFVAIGDNEIRKNKLEWLKSLKVNIASLVHPKSTISKFSSYGAGTCIMANSVINAGTLIKDGAIINTSSSVDHDCIIDDFAHISPNCSLSGNIKVGKLAHLGSGTSVHPGIQIGDNVKTAVGSRIFKDIENNTIFKN